MKPGRELLIDEVFRSQRSILIEMEDAATPLWLHLDLTIAQLKGLFMLAAMGPMTVGQVADTLRIGKPAASILVDRLVQTRLVGRAEDASDRRRTIIRLTIEGEELVILLRQGKRERLQDALEKMSDKDLEALVQGLRALVSSISAHQFVSQR
ncbi:MAG: MarR family transcriptional regulator [Chloroflexi bacterium]|nr:MarR family transcriptional regulator [Chloroflexota bacterium]